METNMALTEKEETDLKDGLAAANKALAEYAPVLAKVPELEKTLAEKNAEISDLKKGQVVSDEDRAIAALQTKYSTVPESTLRALPAASREAEAAKLHESLSKVAPATDPLNAWNTVGNVTPSLDAESDADKLARNEAKDKAIKDGNPQGVFAAKSRDITRFVMNSIHPR
jgi:hypothetical protein